MKNTQCAIIALAIQLISLCAFGQATTLAAGDLLFTGFDSRPANSATTAPFDRVSFVALKEINATTVIYFTDRGYFGGASWQADNGSSEGTIRWTVGTKVAIGTEVTLITGSGQLQALTGGSPNGSVTAFSSVMSLASLDQIIAFQGGAGNPAASSGVTIIAGLHWNTCFNGNHATYTSDATWDNTCSTGLSFSALPPGLSANVSAFWIGAFVPIPPAINNTTYPAAQFNGAGKPYSSVADIRSAVMNKNNWTRMASGDNTAINVPTGHFIGSTLPVSFNGLSATITDQQLWVKWQTQSEANNSHFIVQASVNGSSWSDLGRLESKANGGNSNAALSYNFNGTLQGLAIAGFGMLGLLLLLPKSRNRTLGILTVAALVIAISCAKESGRSAVATGLKKGQVIYVRIQQVDRDGNSTYSEAVHVK